MTAAPVGESGAIAALAAGVVDYAGLFPPAGLDMPTAVANHASYRASADAWMLGRFVVPVARLDEWRAAMAALPADAARDGWRLSGLLAGDGIAECATVAAFNSTSPFGATIDVLEGKATTREGIAALAAAVPAGVTLYVELPHADDPAPLIDAVRAAGVRAKIRTGGVVAEAIPPAEQVERFLRRCHEAGVACKATAGLHHPLRGAYRLTYAPDAPTATMHGWVNVVMAAAAIGAGADTTTALRLLRCDDAARLVVADGTITLDGATLAAGTLEAARGRGVVAFGSCSFREPVDELRQLQRAR